MKSLTSLLATLVACAILATLLFGALAANNAVTRHYDHEEQPLSATEIVMQSRQTAPETAVRGSVAAWGAGLLALAVLALGGTILFMRYGTDFLKQWRLATKKRKARPQYAPQLPPASWEDVPTISAVRNTPRQLMGDGYEDSYR